MSKNKRHRLVVEITDMSGQRNLRQVRWMLEQFIKDGIHSYENSIPGPEYAGEFVNVQVKDYRRVRNAELSGGIIL